MAYQFGPDESIGESIQRTAREQLQKAVEELREGVHSDPVGAVHAARKAIKKERALLRLARRGLSAERRRTDNAILRDAARRLAGLRDAEVMLQALDKLAERYTGQLPEATFNAVREQLEQGRASAHERAAHSEAVAEAIHALAGVEQQVGEWTLERRGWKAIAPGLRRTYRDGQAARRTAKRKPTLENLHEWRKRVKDLWYDTRLLSGVCGAIMRGYADEAEQLSELLGDEHDLGVLRQTISDLSPNVAADLEPLLALVDHRRSQLQAQAELVGKRLYADSPGDFLRRTRRLWKAGRKESRAVAAAPHPISRRRPNTRSNASSSP